MSEPVCQLDEFHFTRVNVEWHEPQESASLEVSYLFDYDVGRHTTENNRYRLVFRVKAISETPTPVGYTIECEIVGYFRFPVGTPQENMDFLIRVNGCNILYGIMRGQLAMVTGSFPNRKFVLPTVMMDDVVNGVEKHKAETRKIQTPVIKQKATKKK